MRGLGANLLLVPQVDGKPGSVTADDKLAMRKFGLEHHAKHSDVSDLWTKILLLNYLMTNGHWPYYGHQ